MVFKLRKSKQNKIFICIMVLFCLPLFIHKITTNTLVLLINTFKDPTVDVNKASDEPEALEIPDIPINKWINVQI